MAVKLYYRVADAVPFLDGAKLDLFLDTLPLSEASRIRRHKKPLDRALRAAGIRALKQLCRQAGVTPPGLSYTPTGKPYFADAPHLALSLSHSGTHALAVLAVGEEPVNIGADLQILTPDLPLTELACRYLKEEDARRVEASPDEEKPLLFARLWSRLEAAVKLSGVGLSHREAAPDPFYLHTETLKRDGKSYALSIACDRAADLIEN